jgi:hypothetical protein
VSADQKHVAIDSSAQSNGTRIKPARWTGMTEQHASASYLYFLIETGGIPQRCRVQTDALATKERLKSLDRDQCIRAFIKHRALIESIAQSKMRRHKTTAEPITVTNKDLSH